MILLLPVFLLALTILLLALLRWLRPTFRYLWLVATGGALLAWISIWLWGTTPVQPLTTAGWQPFAVFEAPFVLQISALTWPYALGLATLALVMLLTAPARSALPAAGSWAAMLGLTGLGLLAVLAGNAVTLLMIWTALDLVELLAQLAGAEEPEHSEGAVISFSLRVGGTALLAWAAARHAPLLFSAVPVEAGLTMVLAVGLRLGVLPLHLPLAPDSALRRDFGSVLRLTSAASALTLLTRLPAGAGPAVLALVGLAGLYAGWNWLRARDELSGRPFWVIGMAALAVMSALNGNLVASAAWGSALVLGGGMLFVSTLQHTWLKRLMLIAALQLTALPYTATASTWSGAPSSWWFAALFLPTQILLIAGYCRHALRPAREAFAGQPRWTQIVYPLGLLSPLVILTVLGLSPWPGGRAIGVPLFGWIAAGIGFPLAWLAGRIRRLRPSAHWVQAGMPRWQQAMGRLAWGLYRWLGRQSIAVLGLLEGDGGLLWAMLVILLFIAYFTGTS